jgi:hypothetical protein
MCEGVYFLEGGRRCGETVARVSIVQDSNNFWSFNTNCKCKHHVPSPSHKHVARLKLRRNRARCVADATLAGATVGEALRADRGTAVEFRD